jgi:hypothetical protein
MRARWLGLGAVCAVDIGVSGGVFDASVEFESGLVALTPTPLPTQERG